MTALSNKEMMKNIREYKAKNCPAYSGKTKAELIKISKDLGLETEKVVKAGSAGKVKPVKPVKVAKAIKVVSEEKEKSKPVKPAKPAKPAKKKGKGIYIPNIDDISKSKFYVTDEAGNKIYFSKNDEKENPNRMYVYDHKGRERFDIIDQDEKDKEEEKPIISTKKWRPRK
jgi:hypothetical protein